MKRRNVLGMAAGLSMGAVIAAPGRADAATGEQLGDYQRGEPRQPDHHLTIT